MWSRLIFIAPLLIYLSPCLYAKIIILQPTDTTVPSCSQPCLDDVPNFCGSYNATCFCTSKELYESLDSCVSNACNITDGNRFQKWSEESCGIKIDKSLVNKQIAFIILNPIVATIFVCGRVYSKLKLDTGLGMDDYTMLAALACYFGDVVNGLGIIFNGFGQHTWNLEPKEVSDAMMFFWICELFYIAALTFTKLSLLLLFLRIFPGYAHRMAIWVIVAFIVLSNFSMLMVLSLQCLPIHGIWTNWMYKNPPVKCINTVLAVYIAAVLSVFHDVLIILFPIPILWGLNLALQKKLSLLILFSLGIFVIICSVLRLPTLMKLGHTTDPSFEQAPVVIWTNLELTTGMICASLPACRPLIIKIFPFLKNGLISLRRSRATASEPSTFLKHINLTRKPKKRRAEMRDTRGFSTLDSTDIFERSGNTGASKHSKEKGSLGSVRSGNSSVKMGNLEPVNEELKLVPAQFKGYGYGVNTTIDVRGDEPSKAGPPPQGLIVMTRTVEVTQVREGADDDLER